MLSIKAKTPTLKTQTNSISAKLFTELFHFSCSSHLTVLFHTLVFYKCGDISVVAETSHFNGVTFVLSSVARSIFSKIFFFAIFIVASRSTHPPSVRDEGNVYLLSLLAY